MSLNPLIESGVFIGKFIARDCPEYYEKHLSDINGDFQKAELNVNSYINLEKISDNSQLE